MANLSTTDDIVAAVLQHAGELSNGNSPFADSALTYVNRVYMELIGGVSTFLPEVSEPWSWAKSQNPYVLTLRAPAVGSAALTNGSVDADFSVAPALSLEGYWIKFDGRSDFFRISQHVVGSTGFKLDQPYTEGSGTLGFKAHKLEYTLNPSKPIMRLIEPMRVYRAQVFSDNQQGKIYGISPDRLTADFPLRTLVNGVPSHFAVMGEVGGVYKVRFNSSVDQDTRVEYDTIDIPADLVAGSTPLLPREDRMFLVYGATYWLMTDKEDPRADTYFRLAQSKLQAMALARRKEYGRTGNDYARMLPRQDGASMPSRLLSDSNLRF